MVAQPDHRITRDAFLYMEPKGDGKDFAQCSTCEMFLSKDRRCAIHGPKVAIGPGFSCGFYIPGKPSPSGKAKAVVTPKESGLVDRRVRCEHCRFLDGAKECGLYEKLNKAFPALFDLDAKIERHGCCNAQEPREAPEGGRVTIAPRRNAVERAVTAAQRMTEKA